MLLQKIESKIHEIRGQKVMLDFDLAEMYEVENRALKQAVNRNKDSFPDDFKFQLTKEEWKELITVCDNLPKGVKYSPATPYAFTEQGVSMLSSVLKSKKAVQVHISIMRAFVALRHFALSYKDISIRLKEIEGKFTDVYEALNYLLDKDKEEKHRMKELEGEMEQAKDMKHRTKVGFKQTKK